MKIVLMVFSFLSLNVFSQGLIFESSDDVNSPVWDPTSQQGYSTYLPKKISYRDYAPIPNSQGQVSTCTGWASAYGMLTTQQNLLMEITNPIQRTARAMDPHFIYSLIKNSSDQWCQQGTSMEQALLVLREYGCKPRIYDPILSCNTRKSYDQYTLDISYPYRTGQYYKLGMDANAISAVKDALSMRYIVFVGMSLTNSFLTGSAVNSGLWQPNSTEKFIGGHAMCVVGYDDDKYGGSFEIMNSYGTEYGDGGFIWVKYRDFAKYMNQAYIVTLPGFQNTGCLGGDCESFGIYRMDNGDMYEGWMTDGYPDVLGTYSYSDGSFYIGDFNHGRKHGEGLFFFVETESYYRVTFSNDALVDGTSIQGYSQSSEGSKAKKYYDHVSQFVPGKLIVEEDEVLQKLMNEIEVPENPIKMNNN